MEGRSREVLAVAILFFVLCWVAVSLRVYCRVWVIRSVGVDDKLMIALLAIFTATLTLQIQGVRYGMGRHKSDISPEDNRIALMYWYISELLYILNTCLLKVSVGYFLLRIAIKPVHIWTLRILMICTVLFGTAYFFLVAFQCVPVYTFWERSPRSPGNCLSDQAIISLTYCASTMNCLAAWVFGILPVFIIWSLSLPVRTRVLAICIVSFAAVGSSATIVRSVYIPTLLDGDDFLFATANVAIWSTVEPGVGITAASVATLRPLWELVLYRAGFIEEAPRVVAWRGRSGGVGEVKEGSSTGWSTRLDGSFGVRAAGSDARPETDFSRRAGSGFGLIAGHNAGSHSGGGGGDPERHGIRSFAVAASRRISHALSRKRGRSNRTKLGSVGAVLGVDRGDKLRFRSRLQKKRTPLGLDGEEPVDPPVLDVQAVPQWMPTVYARASAALDARSHVGEIEDADALMARSIASRSIISAISMSNTAGERFSAIPAHWKRDTLDPNVATRFHWMPSISPTAPKLDWSVPRLSVISISSWINRRDSGPRRQRSHQTGASGGSNSSSRRRGLSTLQKSSHHQLVMTDPGQPPPIVYPRDPRSQGGSTPPGGSGFL